MRGEQRRRESWPADLKQKARHVVGIGRAGSGNSERPRVSGTSDHGRKGGVDHGGTAQWHSVGIGRQ